MENETAPPTGTRDVAFTITTSNDVAFTNTHDVASVVQNEETHQRESDNATKPSKEELLQQRLKSIFGRHAPSVSTCKGLIVTAAVLCLIFILGVVIGVTTKLAKKPTVKKYRFTVQDRGKNYFEDVNIFNGIAMFWTPKHNGIVTSTIIHDFNTGWSGIHDEDHDICFLRRLNKSDFPSLELLQQTVAAQRRVLNVSPMRNNGWESIHVNESSIHHLSIMLQWKCTGQGRLTYYMIPSNATSTLNQTDSCNRVCVPHYALRSGTDEQLHFDMPTVDCVQHNVC